MGTGGVGKTTVAAALAYREARRGRKALVLTIDPARRLRTALKLDKQNLEQKVELEDELGGGELWAAMLDVGATLDRAVEEYATPEQAKNVLDHPIYQLLIRSLSGMQELMAIERLDQAIGDGFETIVIDTAPSRHAFEFFDKSEFFADLVSFPAVRFVGRSYRLLERFPLWRLSRRSLEIYSRLEAVLGTNLIRQILDFYSVFRTIAEGYAERARKNQALLRDSDHTQVCVVTLPEKALTDSRYFSTQLAERDFQLKSLIINRVWPILETEIPSEPLAPTLRWYQEIARTHERIVSQTKQEHGASHLTIHCLKELSLDLGGLPIIRKLADELE